MLDPRVFRRAAPMLLCIAAAFAASTGMHGSGIVEVLRALLVVPALFWAPGAGWASGCADRFDRFFRAVGVSVVAGMPLLVVAQHVGSWVLFVGGAGVCVCGFLRQRARLEPLATGPRVGAAAVVAVVALVGGSGGASLALPLDGNWWFRAAEELPESSADRPTTPGAGWRSQREVGPAWVLTTDAATATVRMPAGVIAVRGPVGSTMRVASGARVPQRVTVEVNPVEDAEEGAVPRYLERGVAALSVVAEPDELTTLSLSNPSQSVVYLIPDAEALWTLHGDGELRFSHYYQLLNMVEQLHWARETGLSRWVTDVQPPLWSWLLGLALLGNHGEQPTANVLFMYLCLAIGWMAVSVMNRLAPRAPLVAWLLPAAAVAEHARLMLEPGSAGMPDSLYTLAVLGVFGGAGLGWAVIAQLARYPGALISALALGWQARWRTLVQFGLGVSGLLLFVGVAGWLSGSLAGWIETATWETGPEHWHGEFDPWILLGRAPTFYGTWLAYAGATPLLALSGASKPARALLGTAFSYSLLLCTVDHFPSHYFLPLVQLSALAVAVGKPGVWAWRPWLALAGMIYAVGWVPVTG
jgi:hypothetical protein